MCYYEGIYKKMNSIIYYSNTNYSKNIATYLSNKSNFNLIDINKLDNYKFNNLIIVFPIHSQNIPKIVNDLLKRIEANNISIIATYGRMSYGNVIYEIIKKYKLNIISAAYIPTAHSYIKNDTEFTDYHKLDVLLDKFNYPNKIKIKKSFKNPLANLFKIKRSQIGVKIKKNNNCNSCNICNSICNNITNGKINNKCIRCLKCINLCPNKALEYKLNIFMRMYLKKKRKDKLVIYT